MRKLAFAVFALALAACGEKSPTDSGSQSASNGPNRSTVAPLYSTATGGFLTVDVPNIINANEWDYCDYPIYFTSTASGTRHLTHVALVVDTAFYSLDVSQLEYYFGPILPVQTTGGAFPNSDLLPSHVLAPYYGYWLVGWSDGGVNYTAHLDFFCKQQRPEP